MARVGGKGRNRLPNERATSAGGIVVRQVDTGPEVVLGRRRRDRDGVTWSLPKGTPEQGETTEQTALREVAEETGLSVRIHKTVHYFLMESTGGDLADHDHEFEEVRWVALSEAETLMSFPTERRIVARALPAGGRP